MRIVDAVRRRLFGGRASDRAAFALWGERARERQDAERPIVAWTDSVVVQRRYIHPTISGNPDENWLIWVKRQFFPEPVDLALTLGCGDGAVERHGLLLGIARAFEAVDASAGAVELAERLARESHVDNRVRYVVADLNRHVFPSRTYDAAFAPMSAHHIADLEHLFAQVRQGLRPGSLFILNEYVGPDQFQWTGRQMALADELLLRLPERYRRSVLSGGIKGRVNRQTRAQMNAVDPTEAIRSSEIVPVLHRYFDVIQRIDYGGTLLNLVLEELTGNFKDEPEDVALLEMLFDAERAALARGDIQSDFTVLVARA
jgi:SAM-dependent methyltransferase